MVSSHICRVIYILISFLLYDILMMVTEVTKTFWLIIILLIEHIYKCAFVGLSCKYKKFTSGVEILKQIYIFCTAMCQCTNAQFQNMNLNSKSNVMILIFSYSHSFNIRIRCHKPIQTFVFKPDLAI